MMLNRKNKLRKFFFKQKKKLKGVVILNRITTKSTFIKIYLFF